MTDQVNYFTEAAGSMEKTAGARLRFPSTTVAAAVLLFGLGAFFTYFGSAYRIGSLRSMGPGMFPVAGGVLLMIIAVLVPLAARRSAEAIGSISITPLAAILGSVVVFSLLLETLGLALSAPLLIAGALVASGQGTLKTGLLLGIPLTAAAVIAFPILLGVPLKVFP